MIYSRRLNMIENTNCVGILCAIELHTVNIWIKLCINYPIYLFSNLFIFICIHLLVYLFTYLFLYHFPFAYPPFSFPLKYLFCNILSFAFLYISSHTSLFHILNQTQKGPGSQADGKTGLECRKVLIPGCCSTIVRLCVSPDETVCVCVCVCVCPV